MSAQLPLCLPGYTAFYNSLNQSPCQMASALGGACNNGVFSLVPLPPGYFYPGPYLFYASSCQCSTVYYSLLSACAYCQGHTYYDWSTFDFNCTITYDQVFMEPIPSSTRIPHYAYLDVVAGNTFNVAAALSAGGLESTPIPQATGSSTTPEPLTTISTIGSSTMPSSTPTPVGHDSTLTAWEISLVVIAVLVFLAIITVGIIVLRRRGGVPGVSYTAGQGPQGITVTTRQRGAGQFVSSAAV